MQLLLIFGIVFAFGAVTFALQNNVPVTVTFALWRFDSTLAVVLLVALGLGALIAMLVSLPAMLRSQWGGARLRRQTGELEKENAALAQRVTALSAEVARLRPPEPEAAEEPKPFAGLRAMLTGESASTPSASPSSSASSNE
ncbi:MAG: lipopolysaccharide assembly protein LapA domain-containing protein [Zoogloeaceae bacterium]|nr:lipopolysaccharide assembly protein LapA domain-containing protein [Zoogloeaceae bacterium]